MVVTQANGGPAKHSLADRMVAIVMKGHPLTWSELAATVGEPPGSSALLSASRTKSFKQRAIVATPKGKSDLPPPDALVFRADALPEVAHSALLWRLALRYLRASANHLHTAGELREAFKPAPLKAAFGAAMKAALGAKTLPAGIGAVLRRGHFYLLLQDDLLTPPVSPKLAMAPAEPEPTSSLAPGGPGESFAEAFERAFDRLDAATGRRNFVKLLSLRQALPQYARATFDRELNALRRAGRFSLDAAEGTHDRTTPEEREAGLLEAGRRLLYCARR